MGSGQPVASSSSCRRARPIGMRASRRSAHLAANATSSRYFNDVSRRTAACICAGGAPFAASNRSIWAVVRSRRASARTASCSHRSRVDAVLPITRLLTAISRMLKKSASSVLASFRPSTYPRGYASGLHSLRPCWTAILSILRECSPIVPHMRTLSPSRSSLSSHLSRMAAAYTPTLWGRRSSRLSSVFFSSFIGTAEGFSGARPGRPAKSRSFPSISRAKG